MIRLYDKENIDNMPELATEELVAIRDFFYPLVKGNVSDYITNVKTTVSLLQVDDYLLPITLNDAEYENAYVSSLYSHYISYSIEEMYLLNQPAMETYLTRLLNSVGKRFKQNDFNKIVYVNNWLFSTNLYVDLSAEQILEVKDYLLQVYPEHMIVFRSLSDYLHVDMIKRFKQNRFKPLASRQVYIAKPMNELNKKQRGYIRADENAVKSRGYKIVEDIEPTMDNVSQMRDLYDQLYIDKYSKYNPKFTEKFFKHSMANPLFKYIGVIKNDEILGCIGYWNLNGVLTTPVLGYHVGLGKQSALYRILSMLIYKEGEKSGLIGHRSSGASEFKLNRGAIPSVEYSMVFDNHLSFKRRFDMKMLRFLCNKVGIKLLKDKKL